MVTYTRKKEKHRFFCLISSFIVRKTTIIPVFHALKRFLSKLKNTQELNTHFETQKPKVFIVLTL